MTNLAITDFEEEYDEFDEDEVNSPEYVDYYFRRKADWEKRIQDLYADIKGWLPLEYDIKLDIISDLPDTLMKKFEGNEKTKNIQYIKIYKKNKQNDMLACIIPTYQWVIGNNGVVQFYSLNTPRINFEITDRSLKQKYIFNKPLWFIANQTHIHKGQLFTKKSFNLALEEIINANF